MSLYTPPIVRFYLLPAEGEPLELITQLVEKAFAARLRVGIVCHDDEMAQRLDQWLWAQLDFVPHCLLSAPEAAHSPVLIASNEERLAQVKVLIYCHDDPRPDVPRGCGRILDIVRAESKDSARQRFAFYRQLGWSPETVQCDPKAR